MGFKAGMTHILRDIDKPGSKLHKKEVVEAVTMLETPPMVVVGFVGYVETPRGLRALTSVWSEHLNDECKRRFYKNWSKSKKTAFTKYQKKCEAASKEGKKPMEAEIERAKKYCQIIRAIVHTQPTKAKIGLKKAHVKEIQINGGSAADKIKFITDLFEKEIRVGDAFAPNEMVDLIGVSRGRGFDGVITRWGVTRLVRKSHRGLRKVACIGTWHPTRVQFQVPRSGQNGYAHRTEINKKIYRMAKKEEVDKSCMTDQDLTEKGPNPMGGFSRYGEINEDWVMIKGTIMGARKRVITMRKSLLPQESRTAKEEINLKFIDTSSKFGHGRFQTSEEKAKFFGGAVTKKAKKEEKTEA